MHLADVIKNIVFMYSFLAFYSFSMLIKINLRFQSRAAQRNQGDEVFNKWVWHEPYFMIRPTIEVRISGQMNERNAYKPLGISLFFVVSFSFERSSCHFAISYFDDLYFL